MSNNLDDLEAVARAATPGPWVATGTRAWGDPYLEVLPVFGVVESADSDMAHACIDPLENGDAEHIATFDPPTVLALIERLKQAEARIAEAREALRAASIPPGVTEAMFYQALIVRADMALAGVFDEIVGTP